VAYGINTGVNEPKVFHPSRRRGLIFQLVVLILLLAVSAGGLWQANKSGFDLRFFGYLLPTFLGMLGVPFLVYQIYALVTASYTLERDGIRLKWGMRYEDIPENQILWVRSAANYEGKLPPPFLRWPGAVVGTRRLADGRLVEYLAEGLGNLVLVGTPQKIYALSPLSAEQFIFTYQRLAETGSLTPLPAHSVYPAFFLSHFWSDQAARWLLGAGALLAFGLLAATAALIPSLGLVSLHIELASASNDAVPAVRLLLLPVINSAIFIADLVLGVFFYRRIENRVLSYLLWGSSIMVSLLFFVSLGLILWNT